MTYGHTWNLCSAFNPSKVHTHREHTHTVITQPEPWAAMYAAVPREQLGLAQGHLSRGIEDGESRT